MSKSVYVGNVPANVSEMTMKQFFSQVGSVVDVWINLSFEKITYCFIEFANAENVNDACNQFNNYELDSFKLIVKPSKRKSTMTTTTTTTIAATTTRNSRNSRNRRESILLELPKRQSCSKNHTLKKFFLKNLNDNKDIIEDFKKAVSQADDIAFPRSFEMIKTEPETSDLATLETTIMRNFESPHKKNTWPLQVDIDLSKGKLLTTEEHEKFFTKPQNVLDTAQSVVKPKQIVVKPKRKKIPFELDYRGVSG